MYDLTFELLEREVRRLVAENPGYVYPNPGAENKSVTSCSYSPNNRFGMPACLFGQAFANLGVSDDDLQAREGWSAQNILSRWLVRGDGLTNDQCVWIANAQRFQDHGIPWGECLDRADAIRAGRMAQD